ncbi:hypothetical protein D3C86_1618850 [compost metagenome]
MLSLPAFLSEGQSKAADPDSLAAAFRLTAHFLNRHVYDPRGLNENAARDGFVQAALKALEGRATEGKAMPPALDKAV